MNQLLSFKLKVLSFFCILAVVWLHAYNLAFFADSASPLTEVNRFFQDFISQGVTRVAVPLFFMISGYLFFINITHENWRDQFKRKITSRFHSLGTPFICWSLMSLALFYFLYSFPYSKRFFSNTDFNSFDLYNWFRVILIDPFAHQFWFIRNLIVMVATTPLLYFLLKRTLFGTIVLFVLFFFWVAGYDGDLRIFSSYLFFSFGCFFAIHRLKVDGAISNTWRIISIAIWLGTVFLSVYYKSILIQDVSILLGIVAVWFGIDWIDLQKVKESPKWEIYISATFFIFCFHEPLLGILKKGIAVLYPDQPLVSLITFWFLPVLTIATAVVLFHIMRKTTPALLNILTGGRE